MNENIGSEDNQVEMEELKLKWKKKKHRMYYFKQESEAAGPPPSSVYLIASAVALLQLAVHGSTVARFPSPSTPLIVELGPRKRIDCLRGRGGGNRREKADFFFLSLSIVGLN
ncbi:hypothetical protein M9H77_07729 [Catharanthus roseus]|uniref:Uncharacterized protein n=1 Tax=Catharanthus roseus TaxID=4058 RepID=A0ACC0BVY7_CATRO|nr:hypothetical protein M9H77_07729 [Catharanthus roseus]